MSVVVLASLQERFGVGDVEEGSQWGGHIFEDFTTSFGVTTGLTLACDHFVFRDVTLRIFGDFPRVNEVDLAPGGFVVAHQPLIMELVIVCAEET